MAKKQRVNGGSYFIHFSFLKEISETWLTKGEFCPAADLLHEIVSLAEKADMISCDKTISKIDSSGKMKIGLITALYDMIIPKKITNNEDLNLEGDEYSLKVASKNKIGSKPAYFIVANNEKEKLVTLARKKSYSLRILSHEDFDLSN